jgi:hypothetical protein
VYTADVAGRKLGRNQFFSFSKKVREAIGVTVHVTVDFDVGTW